VASPSDVVQGILFASLYIYPIPIAWRHDGQNEHLSGPCACFCTLLHQSDSEEASIFLRDFHRLARNSYARGHTVGWRFSRLPK
jgi:hypothetical protein